MDLLNLLDAAWLYVDTYATPMHVANLLVFSAPPGAPEDYVGRLVAEFKAAGRVAPPFDKKLMGGFLSSVIYAWTRDEAPDLDYHVRHSGLPRPGGERELGILVSRLHCHPLDVTRPLWECHFIEGLEGGRFAIYMKMHHSLIDGVSGMRLLQRRLTPDPDRRDRVRDWGVRARCPWRRHAPIRGVGRQHALQQPHAADAVDHRVVHLRVDGEATLGQVGDIVQPLNNIGLP